MLNDMRDDTNTVTVITSLNGNVALVDRDGNIVAGPADPADDRAWSELTTWLRNYVLDKD